MNARGIALAAFLYLILPLVQVWVYLNGLPFADTIDVARNLAT